MAPPMLQALDFSCFFLYVPSAAPLASGVVLRTSFIGNSQHAWDASAGFDHQLNNMPIQWLGVRWDGDKVRGLSFRLFDGSQWTQGDFSNQYAFSEIAFVPGMKRIMNANVQVVMWISTLLRICFWDEKWHNAVVCFEN